MAARKAHEGHITLERERAVLHDVAERLKIVNEILKPMLGFVGIHDSAYKDEIGAIIDQLEEMRIKMYKQVDIGTEGFDFED